MDMQDEKEVEYYAATVNAWYTTKLEKDKHLLSLSSAAIAILVTLATTVGATDHKTVLVYFLAVTSFLVCIICVLSIFDRNSVYLENTINEVNQEDSVLKVYDKISSSSFILGLIFSLLVGFFSIIDNLRQNGEYMSNNEKQETVGEKRLHGNSLNGAHKLRPKKEQKAQQQDTLDSQKKDSK